MAGIMEFVDTLQQNHQFEEKISVENMNALDHPDQGTNDGENQDAILSDSENVTYRPNNNESIVKDMDEESVDGIDQNLSSRRCRMIILSDDEDSNPPSTSVTSPLMENENSVGQSKMRVIASDSENEEESSLFYKKPNTEKPKVGYNPNIFDTELSDEDQPPQSNKLNYSSAHQECEKTIPSKEKKVNKVKQAQQELKDIHSESQRLVRESRVSLPYHRPKQRTFAEFIARRKQTMPPKIQNQSLKMTMRNMEILKLLEEKKKQVDEFYKSDSDSEDAADPEWTPENPEKKNVSADPEWTPENPEKKNVSPEAEESNSFTATKKSIQISDETLPDLNLPFNESSTQKRESCPEFLVKNDTVVSSEDEGLGGSEKNLSRDHSSFSDISQSGDIEVTHHTKNNSPLIEHMNSENEKKEKNFENVGNETCDDHEDLGNKEKSISKESMIVEKEKTSNNSDTPQLTTPKFRLLASKLPKEELEKIMAITPKLNSGKKGDVIDLDEPSPSQNPGMSEFINRFLRHADAKQKPAEKQQVNLNIVSKQDDGAGREQLVSTNLLVTVHAKEEQLTKEAVPGSHLTFKAALQAKIRKQREAHRLRRVQEKQFMETEELPEDYQDDDLPNEEAELTDQSETDYETESEPEENDVLLVDKKTKQNCYVDDEAEEEDEGDLEPDINDLEDATGPASDSDDENDTSEAIKERKRIIKNTDDDSEVEDNDNMTLPWDETQELESEAHPSAMSRSNTDDLSSSLMCKKGETLDKDTSTTSFDSSFELYGSVIAGHQPRSGMKFNAENGLPLSLTKNKSASFSSTLSSSSRKDQEITLPAEDSVDIFNNEAIGASPGGIDLNFSSLDCTQPHESNKENEPFAKLQLDFSRIEGTQDKDELIGLCTGQFSEQTEVPIQTKELYEDHISQTQEMSELLGLCSGHFAGHKEGKSNQLKNTEGGPKTLPISQDDPDDDELLGLCTAKFNMSADSHTGSYPEKSEAKETEKEDQTEASPKMIIYSSDDEDSVDIKAQAMRRKKRKRVIEFSDDEDAQEPLAFDDEENEISATVFTGFKDNGKRGIRAEFLENEAELSGSDLNSGDEAEESEDDFEEMEGDREHFDSNELRDQVGKAHLKSLLDSDKREVRLLQELYLEDGELHGQGRSRQFRWKNLDKRIEDDERKTLSEEEGSDDNMEDSEWRKQKTEREFFLKEQRAKMADMEAELYKVDSWPSLQDMPKEDLGKKKPLAPVSALKKHRGSFLNRDRNTLARIAEFTRDRRDVVGGAKQGGNFVFQQLGADEPQEKVEEESVAVSQKSRDSFPPKIKKAKVDKFSWSRENSQSSSSVFEFL